MSKFTFIYASMDIHVPVGLKDLQEHWFLTKHELSGKTRSLSLKNLLWLLKKRKKEEMVKEEKQLSEPHMRAYGDVTL